jgi:hypothetical protein
MQLAPVGVAVRRGTLAEVVECVPDELVGDEQAQQIAVAPARERPEERRSVDVGALVLEDVERVGADRLVRDSPRTGAPAIELARYGVQAPEQLACRCLAQPPQLAGAQRRRVTRSRALNRSDFKAARRLVRQADSRSYTRHEISGYRGYRDGHGSHER